MAATRVMPRSGALAVLVLPLLVLLVLWAEASTAGLRHSHEHNSLETQAQDARQKRQGMATTFRRDEGLTQLKRGERLGCMEWGGEAAIGRPRHSFMAAKTWIPGDGRFR